MILNIGNGYCRSEAVVAMYLQKSSNAKRVYATIVHSRSNTDGSKEQGKLLNFYVYMLFSYGMLLCYKACLIF